SGVHQIKASDGDLFDVLCDSQLAGPGWMVVQQRVGGTEDFQRDWATYRKGFGSFDSDFFLGLEKIHRLTSSVQCELYVHLDFGDGKISHARYNTFKLTDEDHGYALNLDGFKGNTTDELQYSNHMKFTTIDRDNDNYKDNCATYANGGGWWHNSCFYR
ncbi:hypothetical protein KR044_008738, partial [Drosophila immigrans]